MLTDGKGWRSERLCLLKDISTTHTIPGTETTRLWRQTWVSHAVDRKPNTLETRNKTWLFTVKPLKKNVNGGVNYRHQRFIYTEFWWNLSRVTNCRNMTSHSLPGIRNERSSRFFITCAKLEDTLTCKASGNNFPHRESISTDRRVTVHCILTTTTPGPQD